MNNFQTSPFPNIVGFKVRNLLIEKNAIVRSDVRKFAVWARSDRVVVIMNTDAVDINKLNDKFTHALSTRLNGRRVIMTNHRGVCFQVGYGIPLATRELTSLPLDLSKQPSPFHIPVGEINTGPLWIDLLEADSIFLAGMRGTGKSNIMQGFIQALLHGNQTLIHAWDGKHNAEFLRYYGRENFTLCQPNGLNLGMKALHEEAIRRLNIFAMSGHTSLVDYNKSVSASEFIKPIAFIVDEVAEVVEKDYLNQLVKLFRAPGIYPIFATNDWIKSSAVAKSNLATRICLHVGSPVDSVTAYGRVGANRLPFKKGRGLIQVEGRDTEFQAYLAALDAPSDTAREWQKGIMEQQSLAITQPTFITPIQPTIKQIDEIAEMAELIRERWHAGMSKNSVAKLFGRNYSGASWTVKIDKIIAYLTSSSTSSSTSSEEKQAESPVLTISEG